MSLVLKILESIWNAEMNYKGVRVNGFGIPKAFLGYEDRSVSSTVSRLKRKGYIKHASGGWVLTASGRKYYESRTSLRQFDSPFEKGKPKDLIVMFDIPEAERYEREWLRNHLRKFDYKMIQKSVWVGPSPLPREFVEYIKEIGVKSCIKTFKLAKPYKQKKSY